MTTWPARAIRRLRTRTGDAGPVLCSVIGTMHAPEPSRVVVIAGDRQLVAADRRGRPVGSWGYTTLAQLPQQVDLTVPGRIVLPENPRGQVVIDGIEPAGSWRALVSILRERLDAPGDADRPAPRS